MDEFIEKLRKGNEEALELAVECTGKYTEDVEAEVVEERKWEAAA